MKKNDVINGELIITIKDPAGESAYKEETPIYFEVGEQQFVMFSWDIPATAVTGTYTFKAEFKDLGGLPTIKSFEVY